MANLKIFSGSPNDYYQLVFTDPAWLYNHCLLGGFQFSVDGDNLLVTPSHQIDYELASLIIKHKAALMQIIGHDHFAGGEHDA